MNKKQIIVKYLNNIEDIYVNEYKGVDFEEWLKNISEKDLKSILKYHKIIS